MKSRFNPFISVVSFVASVAFSPLFAATIDTTGSTAGTPVILAAANTYIGNGFLNADTTIALGGPDTFFAMTDGLFTIQSGVTLTTNRAGWAGNLADLQIDGTLDVWDNDVETQVDALSGAGGIVYGYPWNNRMWVHVGLNNGSGTFSGTVQAVHFTGNGVQMIKSGTGTQTFNNLANQPFKNLTINAGTVNLSTATDVSVAYPITGAGNLLKSGAGVLTLTGSLGNTGTTTVSEGSLSTSGSGITSNSNFVVNTGAVLGLNFASPITINSLELGASGPLPVGVYGSSHPTYGSFFTGTGSLRIQGAIPDNDGNWTSLASGNWSTASNWSGSAVASGVNLTATFGAATGVAVTVDQVFTIGHLNFNTNGYSLTGSGVLTLNDSFKPQVSVATGVQTRIEAPLGGSNGFEKVGNGTLTLAGSNVYTGTAAISSGRLVIESSFGGSPNFFTEIGASLEFNLIGGTEQVSNGTISGGGTLLKTGADLLMFGAASQPQTIALESGALIDIQAGAIRNEFGNSAWGSNLADLTVASGAIFDIWDGNTQVDAINGSGTINKGWEFDNTLTIGADGGIGSFSGIITNVPNPGGGINGSAGRGLFNLDKVGTGTQAFTGTTNFGGNLKVSAGVLSLGNGTDNTSLSDTHSVSVEEDATLNLNFTGSDTVASVTLGSTTYTTPGATFGASNFPAFFTGPGTLMIAGSASDYDNWVLEKGVIGGPDDDDDNDGVNNREEHAFGLLPLDGSSVNPIATPLNKAAGTFSYTRRKLSLGTNLTYSVWFSTNLVGWTKDTGVTEGTLVPSGDNETVPVTLSALAGSPLPNKLFIQVRAE